MPGWRRTPSGQQVWRSSVYGTRFGYEPQHWSLMAVWSPSKHVLRLKPFLTRYLSSMHLDISPLKINKVSIWQAFQASYNTLGNGLDVGHLRWDTFYSWREDYVQIVDHTGKYCRDSCLYHLRGYDCVVRPYIWFHLHSHHIWHCKSLLQQHRHLFDG